MEMRDGMLGVVVVALAITVALFGAVLAGVTSHDEEVTKYNYLTEVSSFFDYDQSPTYIEFDPSTNYTGYYSEDSYSEFFDQYYFAIDQVDFEKYNGVNNYKIKQEPQVRPLATQDLSTLDIDSYDSSKRYDVTLYWEEHVALRWENSVYRLQDVIDEMNLDANATNLQIVMPDANWDDTPMYIGSLTRPVSIDLGSILIVPMNWVQDRGSSFKDLWLVNPLADFDVIQEDSSATFHIPYEYFDVDLTLGTVTAYDYNGGSNEYSVNNMLVYFGETIYPTVNGLQITDDMSYYEYITPEAVYLNPNYGVWLKDE